MVIACLLVLAAAQIESAPSDRYMIPASYPAGSLVDDPKAAGGYGKSNNFPKSIDRKELLGKSLKALLLESKAGVALFIGNDQAEDQWLRAADGNLLGFLEAQRADGKWAPIEYQAWYSCGNSYHRVHLPKGMQWNYFRPIPHGSLKTKIRWRLSGETDLISNEVEYWINPDRFKLDPRLAKDWEIHFAVGTAYAHADSEEVIPDCVPKGTVGSPVQSPSQIIFEAAPQPLLSSPGKCAGA